MKLCDRCPVSGCCLDYLGKACQRVRRDTCPGLRPNRMELISNMDMDSMASLLGAVRDGLLKDEPDIRAWLAAEGEI